MADQSYESIEHIVIDGGSGDRTLEIVNDFPHISTVISEPDKGIYDAMNKGVLKASGDVVAILNSDDYYMHPEVISQVMDMFATHDCDAVLGDVVFAKANQPETIIRRYRSKQFHSSRIAYGWMPAHPALFLKKAVYDTYGLFDTSYKIAGDFDFVARIFKDDTITYQHMDEPLVCMQPGGASTSGIGSKIVLNKEVMQACRANNIPTNWCKLLSKYPQKILEFLFKK